MIRFSKLNSDGTETDVRNISQSDIKRCPHYILAAEHYRADNSCRCNDRTHKVMIEWGYVWNGSRWEVGNDDEA